MNRLRVVWLLLFLAGAVVCLSPTAALARPLASFDLTIAGIELTVGPATQSVPKGVTSTVTTQLTIPQVSIPVASLQKLLPQNLTVKGELSGPAFPTPITLSAPAGTPLTLPTLPLLGTYSLRNLRLVVGTGDILAASPSVVTIEAIDDVLVTNVITRPLSLDEIRQRGIAVDQSNFTVLNFTAAVGTQSNRVNIDFPVIIPKTSTVSGPDGALPPEPPALTLPTIANPNLVAKPIVFVPVMPTLEGEDPIELPPIPALLVFPGNIGFLHQFFQALLIVTNGAPEGSSLTVQDLVATIQLPTGEDRVAGTDEAPGDDPLRVARIEGQGFVHSLPVKAAGPDGQFGTSDDATILTPEMTGHADFSVEGLREGVHEVAFDIQGTLLGLPRGPVPIQGRARGAILVRNPNFALTLSHPNVVRRGELYDLFATITNTSQADANLVSISLDPRGVSGAQLLSEARVEFPTVQAGESATAKFTLQSLRTGQVTATAVQSDEGILGRFSLRAGVGELGIPLSPDTLVLPTFANTLPADLLEAGMGLLGQAYSVATAPEGALPPGIARIPRDTVTQMATSLSEAGLRIQLGETVLRSVEDLLFDFAGTLRPFDGLRAQGEALNDPAFDSLRRQSSQGAKLAAAVGAVLGTDVASRGLLTFQEELAGSVTSRAPHLSIVASAGLRLKVSDDAAHNLGKTSVDGSPARGIPFGDHIVLGDSGSTLDLVTNLTAALYTVQAVAAASGSVDLGIVFLGASGSLEQVRFSGVPVQEGSALTLTLVREATNAYALAIDDDGDGRPDRTIAPTSIAAIPDRGPEVVSVVQIVNQFPPQRSQSGATTQLTDKFGRLVGILFSERVDPASASTLANYAVEANQVNQVLFQPSGRLVVLSLKNALGPFVPRTLTVTGLADARGNPLTPASITRPITATIGDGGGVVSGAVRAADGSPLAGAVVTVQQTTEDDFGFEVTQTVSEQITDAASRYQFDFVLGQAPFTLTAVAPGGQDSASVRSTLTESGQRLNVDLVMLGRGVVAGTVRNSSGTPVANAVVTLQAVGGLQSFATRAAGEGSYRFDRVPVGGFTITAYDAAANRGYAAGTLAAAGSTAQADVTILPPVATVSVSGQVFRSDGITPIPGVPVVLNAAPTSGAVFTTFVYSDATASFRFTNIPSGVLALRAYDPATGEAGQATITLAPGESDSVAIVFGGLGTISGQVVTASGTPVPFATVVAGASLVTADATGRFTISNVPVGSHTVRGQHPETGNIGQATVALLSSGQTVEVTVVLPAAGTITGRVYQADGVTPILDPDVRIITEGGYSPAMVDATGRYTFENRRVGSYQVGAIKGNAVALAAVTIAADGQVVRKDFVLPTGTGKVTGTVTDQGSNNQPVAATVSLSAQMPGPTGRPETRAFANVISDASTGRFVFDNVPLGAVSVSARSILRPNPASASGTLTTAGQTLDFALVLRSNIGSISGTVIGTDGNPVGGGIRVSVENQRFPSVTVTTNGTGQYAFAAILPQDSYTLTAEEPASGLKGQSYVSVTAGQDVKVNPRILGKGSVLVIVREANGRPVLNGTLDLTGGTFVRDQASGILTPDMNGQFTFPNITEGPFSVTARDAHGLKGLANGLVPRAGAVASVTITLTPSGTIGGRFHLPDGAGVGNAQITLTDATGTPRAFTTTSSDPADVGRFSFGAVPVGSYGLQGFDPATGRRGATGVRLDLDGQTVTADFATVSLGSVSGTVFSGDGTTPIAGADVRITPAGLFSQPAMTQSGPDGTFTFPGVSAGGFAVQVTDPTTTLAGATQGTLSLEGETVTISVRLEPSGTIEGRVLKADGTTPVANAQVTLTRPGTPFTRSTQSEADGRYRFTHIPVGDVRLDAREPAGIDIASASRRIGSEGEVVPADIIMVGTGMLTGLLRDSNGVDPVAGVTVTGRSLGANPLTLTTATAADGTFRFDRFPVGSFSLTARTVAGLGAATGGTLAGDGTTIDVLMLLEASGTVGGLVLMPDGATPARGITVTLTSPRLTTVTTSEGDGRFLFEGIPLGVFHLDLLDPVGGGIQRADGSLTTNGQAFNAGTLLLDDQAVAVTAISPMDGAVNVPVTSTVTVTFSEKVQRNTVTGSSIRVLAEGAPIAGALSFAVNDTEVVFTPAQTLIGSRRYTLQVTAAITDLVGHPLLAESVTSFTTVDNVPPTATEISPAADAIQVAPEAVVRVTFSEAIDPGSVTQSAITVTGADGPVAGRVDLILNNTVLVFTPVVPLASNAQYGVTLGTVRDRAGNPLTPPAGRTFSTIDTIPPTVRTLAIPPDARTIEGRTVTITATSPDTDASRVEFFGDETLLGTVTGRPFALTVLLPAPTRPDRTLVLSAIAIDRVGNRGPAASLTVTVEPPLPTLTSLLPPVLPLEMGGTGNLTATISRVQASDTAVPLASDRPEVASVAASATVPAGHLAVPVPVGAGIPGTATITATLNDSVAHSIVTVTPVGPTLASLRPASVQVTQGASGTLTLTLTAAPAADAEVSLTSSNPSLVGLSPLGSVVIPAGQTTQAFAVFGVSPGQATVIATFNYTSAQVQVSVVTPLPTVVSLLPPVLPLTEGSRGALSVTLNASQPTDTTVMLGTSDPTIVRLPADRVIVPAHQHSATVYVTGLRRGLTTVTASLADSTATVGVEVVPPPSTVHRFTCPAVLAEGATALCRVSLNATQPADTTVPLSVSTGGVVQVPGSVTVPAGSLYAEVGVTALAAGTESILAGPVNGTTQTTDVQVVPPYLTIVSLTPETAAALVGATATLHLTLNAAAPADTAIPLAASPVGVLDAPTTVTIPAGRVSTEITITGVATGTATLLAGPLNGAAAQTTLTVNQVVPTLSRIDPTALSLPKGKAGSLEVTIAPTQPEATVVPLASNDPGVEVPERVTVAAGERTAEFPVLARTEGSATVTAGPLNTTSQQATVTVTAPQVVSLSISPPVASIGVGETQQFTVMATYTDTTVRDVTAEVAWTSSDPGVATISAGGLATGRGEGTVTIAAALAGAIARVPLTVTLWSSTGPVITLLSPDRGTVGTPVQIFGSGFSTRPTDNQVAFNGTPAAVTAATETSLTVSVPAGATTGPVSVTTPAGMATSPGVFTVLQLFEIIPGSATVALGGSVGFRATLDGIPTTGVTWRVNGVAGGSPDLGTVNSSGLYTAPNTLPAVLPIQVEAVLAADPSRIVTATVQVVSQTSGVLASPAVSVAVAQGAPSGNAQALAAPVSVAVAQSPPSGTASALSGPVSVAVAQAAPSGSAHVQAAAVSVSAGPIITAVSPTSGRVGTSVSVTISGGNLQGASAVQVIKNGVLDGTVTASSIVAALDGTSVACTLTIGSTASTGARVLQIVTPQGRSSNFDLGTNGFTVLP